VSQVLAFLGVAVLVIVTVTGAVFVALGLRLAAEPRPR
jgi:hypothetical protein